MAESTQNSDGEIFYVGDKVKFSRGGVTDTTMIRTIAEIDEDGAWRDETQDSDYGCHFCPKNLVLVKRYNPGEGWRVP